MKNGKYQNSMQDKRLCNVETHIETINSELGDVKVNMAKIRTDVNWIKKNYWIVASASIGALITALFNVLKK